MSEDRLWGPSRFYHPCLCTYSIYYSVDNSNLIIVFDSIIQQPNNTALHGTVQHSIAPALSSSTLTPLLTPLLSSPLLFSLCFFYVAFHLADLLLSFFSLSHSLSLSPLAVSLAGTLLVCLSLCLVVCRLTLPRLVPLCSRFRCLPRIRPCGCHWPQHSKKAASGVLRIGRLPGWMSLRSHSMASTCHTEPRSVVSTNRLNRMRHDEVRRRRP